MNDTLAKLNHHPKRSERLKLAAILGTLAAFAPLSIDMYISSLPHIAEELSTSPSIVQLSLSFFMIGLALGQLLAGPLSDVRGRRTPLLIGLAIYSVTSLLCALSPSIWIFITLRFFQGLSGAAGIVLSRAIVRDLFSGLELTKFFSLLALINGIAPILAPILGSVILLFAPWEWVFIVLSLIGAMMFLLVFFHLQETLPLDSRSVGGINQTVTTFKQLCFDRSFIGFALSQALVNGVLFAYISGSSFVLQNIYGTSPQMYGLIFAMNGIGISIASQIAGRLAGRIRETKLFLAGIGMAAFGSLLLLILLLLHASLYFILPPLLISVASIGIVSTMGHSLALQNQGKIAGSASALIGVMQFVLASIISPLTGLGSHPAISMGIAMTSASLMSIITYFLLVGKNRLKVRQDPSSESI